MYVPHMASQAALVKNPLANSGDREAWCTEGHGIAELDTT